MTACPVCQTPVQGNATICAVCGSPLKTKTTGPALAPGTRLDQGRYRIDSFLGQGGFGITYRAYDLELGREVAIKELFNAEFNARQGNIVLSNVKGFQETIQDFLAEARLLAQFNHPGIIRIFDTFLENGTAYYTMELLNGQTLEERIAQSGHLPANEVQDLAIKLGQTLEVLHQRNFLHRDIKPANIFLSNDNRAILLDFGSARQYQQNQTVNHTRLVTPGYAPLEQYQSQGKFGPCTDIYALSATLLHALTGTMPPDALSRLPQEAGGQGAELPPFPNGTVVTLTVPLRRGLALKPADRQQTMTDFVAQVQGRTTPAPPPPQGPPPPPQGPPPIPSEREVLVALIGKASSKQFLDAFDKLSRGGKSFQLGAFLFGPFWLFYRKVTSWAWILLVIEFLIFILEMNGGYEATVAMEGQLPLSSLLTVGLGGAMMLYRVWLALIATGLYQKSITAKAAQVWNTINSDPTKWLDPKTNAYKIPPELSFLGCLIGWLGGWGITWLGLAFLLIIIS